jgi:2-dehydro-3-deoxygalactonokinase
MKSEKTELIGLDWGTSSLRAYRLGRSGTTLDQRCFAQGVMNLPFVPNQPKEQREELFQTIFEEACGDWALTSPNAPIIACGMVGSSQGWWDVPYLQIPLPLSRLGAALTMVQDKRGHVIRVVPGLIQSDGFINVMRGEETQVLGSLSSAFEEFPSSEVKSGMEILVGMPGSHSKWVYVRQDCIIHFETFMTGELYDALCSHTILGRTMIHGGQVDFQAFYRGIQAVNSATGEAGVMSSIFSVRALGLVGELAPTAQPDYLSGLLIGHEIAAVLSLANNRTKTLRQHPDLILLAGNSHLCDRYIRVFASYGGPNVYFTANASERGLWNLAVQAGLVARD